MRPALERAVFYGRRSATMAWAYFLIFAGLALDVIDFAALLLEAQEVRDVITSHAGPYTAHALKAIGVITAIARVRSLRRAMYQ